jgi:hypothetical protein
MLIFMASKKMDIRTYVSSWLWSQSVADIALKGLDILYIDRIPDSN